MVKNKFRSLVGTDAEVFSTQHRVYNSLKVKPKLQHKKINLSSVNGDALKIDGCIKLTFTIGDTEMQHLFYIMRDMNRNLILGTGLLHQHGVRIYYDFACIRISNKTYMNLEEYISLVARIKYTGLTLLVD